MTVRVAINGYGRIGRNILRSHYEDGKKHVEKKTRYYASLQGGRTAGLVSSTGVSPDIASRSNTWRTFEMNS